MEENRLVRRRGGFSDRNNIHPISKEMQFLEFDERTRIKLKNLSLKIIDVYMKPILDIAKEEKEFHPYSQMDCFALQLEGMKQNTHVLINY